MSESVEKLRNLIDQCSEQNRRDLKLYLSRLSPHRLEAEWGIDADTILSAINRSSDLTKRGVRGIIAEAVFVDEILPTLSNSGWQSVKIEGDHPFDALLKKSDRSARIQVKLQRLEKGLPKLYYPKYYAEGSLFVVEVQKTRTGERKTLAKIPATGEPSPMTGTAIEQTRPYSFGDFDILAVNMQPSNKDWMSFRYTVASWLLPRPSDERLIEIFQPVAARPNDIWTDDLGTCLGWFENGREARVLVELIHQRKAKKR
ncbi:MAG: hypothetical protein ACLGP3_05955 [Acidobacteriota bacterium]